MSTILCTLQNKISNQCFDPFAKFEDLQKNTIITKAKFHLFGGSISSKEGCKWEGGLQLPSGSGSDGLNCHFIVSYDDGLDWPDNGDGIE